MIDHAFDHEHERPRALRTPVLAAASLALAAVAGIGWAVFRSDVQAGPSVDIRQIPSPNPAPTQAQPHSPRATLIEAAKARNSEVVARLLAKGADPDAVDGLRMSALSHAIRNGDSSMVRRLLAAGARLGEADRGCGSDLHLAAEREDPLLLKLILTATPDVDERAPERDEASALHIAGESGHVRTVEALLDAGADIEARDARGFTPLARASLLSRHGVVEALIRRGADVQAGDARGRNALHHAAAVGDSRCVRALLAAGASAGAPDGSSWTGLHFAAAHGHADVLALLVERQDAAALGARTSRGMSALHLAARRGEPNALRFLLGAGLDPDARDADGRGVRDLLPEGRSDVAGLRIAEPATTLAPRKPLAVLLDSRSRPPLLSLCTHPARKTRAAEVLLDMAVWDDGAMLFSPWSTDSSRTYLAGVLKPTAVASLVHDLEETGWFEQPRPPIDTSIHDCVELTLTRASGRVRSLWDELDRSELDPLVRSRAAQMEQVLAWARVRDILRGLRPEATQELAFVLVRGGFRGLSFEDGAQAEWMR